MPTSYPKWIYVKKDGGGVTEPHTVEGFIIETPNDLKKIKESWAESPAGPFVKPSVPKPKRTTKSRG
jgi:hypothetical protein